MAQRKAQTKNRTTKVRTYWQKQFNTFQDHMEEKLDTKCTKTAMAAKGILFGLGLAPARKPEKVFEVASPNGKIQFICTNQILTDVITDAVTLFELVSLLPFKIEQHMALLVCNKFKPFELEINLDGFIYVCNDGDILVECPNTSPSTDQSQSTVLECQQEKYKTGVYCRNSILFSINDIVCNTTTTGDKFVNIDKKHTILGCYSIFKC